MPSTAVPSPSTGTRLDHDLLAGALLGRDGGRGCLLGRKRRRGCDRRQRGRGGLGHLGVPLRRILVAGYVLDLGGPGGQQGGRGESGRGLGADRGADPGGRAARRAAADGGRAAHSGGTGRGGTAARARSGCGSTRSGGGRAASGCAGAAAAAEQAAQLGDDRALQGQQRAGGEQRGEHLRVLAELAPEVRARLTGLDVAPGRAVDLGQPLGRLGQLYPHVVAGQRPGPGSTRPGRSALGPAAT